MAPTARYSLFSLFCCASCMACAMASVRMSSEDGTRAERFADPPASARILPIRHIWQDDRRNNDKELRDMALNGFGGMVCNVSFGTNYLDSASGWDTMRHVVKAAKAAGMALWLYDENGYPSGTARDKTLKGHPEWQACGLLVAVTNVSAGAHVELELPPGALRLAVACPIAAGMPDTDAGVNLDACARRGKVVWDAPVHGAARWRVFGVTEDYLYESTHSALSLALRQPYINLLMRDPTARFIELTHERYAKELGNDVRAFTSTFTDEPSLMSNWVRPMPYYVLPWCRDLPDDYRARTGRDLMSDVPAIVCENASGASPQIRHDFWNLVGDRVSRNYMGQIAEWSARHGLLSGGHLLAEERLSAHVAYYGDFFRCLRAFGAPGVDCLTSIPSSVPWITAQFCGSAAALNGSRYAMCEVSDHSQRKRRPGDTRPVYQVSEDEITGTLNRLVWGGVNTFTSYYRWSPFGREEIKRINTTIGRSVTLMAEGWNAAEVALLYPSESLMATYRPGLHGGGGFENSRVASTFGSCGAALFEGHRPFMFVDSASLAEARVDGDALVRGGLRWRVVVLPRVTTIAAASLRNVHAFWKAGGAVVAVGSCPENSETSFPDATARRLCAEMFGEAALRREPGVAYNAAGGRGVFLAEHQAASLSGVLDALVEPPVTISANAANAPLRVARRRTVDGEILFLFNDSRDAWRGAVRLCGDIAAELWNPRTGAHGPAPVAANGIDLELPPYGAVLLTTSLPLAQSRRTYDPGAFACETIPFGVPVKKADGPSRAHDVEAESRTGRNGSAWARARILKSGVDTFMCIPFAYETSPCTGDMRGVTFETRVDAAQRYAPELLVFALMDDGSLYLSHTGRSLADKGRERSYVPFSSFVRHGRSGKMQLFDPSRIRQLKIGFGGYFGEEGQTIAFAVSPPAGYR